MPAVKTQIKKDPKAIKKPKSVQNKEQDKEETEQPKKVQVKGKKVQPKEKQDVVKVKEKKPTQGQKLLQAMTAQKAAKEALLKGVTNTKVSFDDEGNEKVETVVQKLENANKTVNKKKPAAKTEETKPAESAKETKPVANRPAQKKPEKRKKEEQEGQEVVEKETSKKRAKKDKKSKAELEEIRKDSKQEEAMEYVRTFANDKKNWKFKKVQQIWILQNLYKIPESEFDNVLKYLKDLQGSSREKTIKEAEEKIPKKAISNNLTGYANVSDDEDDFDAEKLLNQVPKEQPKVEEETNEIKRARLIVQVLS